MADRVIGLDIGASSIKAVQVARGKSNREFIVEKQAAAPLPHGTIRDGRVTPDRRGQVIEAIKALCAEAKFSTKEAIVGLNSSSAVFMQEMLVPLMSPADLPKALPQILEARQEHLADKDYLISHTVIGEEDAPNGRMLRVLVYWVRSTYANDIAQVVVDAGLDVVGADLNALAALRAVALQERPPRQVDAIVDFGSAITILMLHHNGVPKMLSFDPDSSGEVVTQRIAEVLGLEPDDPQAEFAKIDDQQVHGPIAQIRAEFAANLASKIASGFSSYLATSDDYDSIANVTLVGGGALLAELAGSLRQAFGTVPLTYAAVNPAITTTSGGQPQRTENQSGGDYLVAIGLGTGERA